MSSHKRLAPFLLMATIGCSPFERAQLPALSEPAVVNWELGSSGVSASFIAQNSAASVFISPNGNDSAPGSKDQPVRTLTRARELVRQIKSTISGDIVVYLRQGIYPLTKPEEFGSADGAADRTILYTSFPGETATISGGQVLANWSGGPKPGTIQIDVPGVQAKQLYGSHWPGTQPRRARWPSQGSLRLLEIVRVNGSFSHFRAAVNSMPTATFVDRLGIAEGVIRHSFSQSRFRVDRVTISGAGEISVFPESAFKLGFDLIQEATLVAEGQELHFEGSPDFIDRPGDWAQVGTQLTFWPRSYDPVAQGGMVVGRTDTLIKFAGAPSAPVEGLWFDGIHFRHTQWSGASKPILGSQGGLMNNGFAHSGAIEMLYTANIKFTRNRFCQMGATGVVLLPGNREVTFNKNLFEDIAGNALVIGPFWLSDPSAPAQLNRKIEVSHNLIQNIGLDYPGIGVMAGYLQNSSISHNHMRGLAYSAISVGWFDLPRVLPAVNTVIANNDISTFMQRFNDGGGIYTIGHNQGLNIVGNYIHDLNFTVDSSNTSKPGIYLDGYSSDIPVKDNYLKNLTQGLYLQTLAHPKDTRAKRNVIQNLLVHAVDEPIHSEAKVLAEAVKPEVNNQLNVVPTFDSDWSQQVGLSGEARTHWKTEWSNASQGVFRVGPGIYYSSGASYCVFASWSDYLSATNSANPRIFPLYSTLPSTQAFHGSCIP